MEYLSLKIQTSTLLLKAKHALSLHRKSSASGSAPSSSSQSSTLSSIPLPSTDSPVSPPLPNTSITPATHIDTAPTPILDNVPHKTKRSSRFKVKTFPSFRESASSLHTKTNQSSKVSRTSDLVNTVIGPGIPSQPMASVNPYSPLWCPSTVTALKSPLRNASLLRSKSNSYLDLSQISHYSPAPNLILQPSPSVDLASCYAGARSSTLPAMVRYHSTSGEFAAARGFVPVIGPQGNE
ncbi:hypothetical protein BX616_001393 [Lobosporangium transversale]|nr:hypothetical protein BX616_001393 [Lobosporangium transversale]